MRYPWQTRIKGYRYDRGAAVGSREYRKRNGEKKIDRGPSVDIIVSQKKINK